MSKVIVLNGKEHNDVLPEFLDGITNRLSGKLTQSRSANRMPVDYVLVVSELDRMYGPALKQKPWYRDYVKQFCRDRRIPCPDRF